MSIYAIFISHEKINSEVYDNRSMCKALITSYNIITKINHGIKGKMSPKCFVDQNPKWGEMGESISDIRVSLCFWFLKSP